MQEDQISSNDDREDQDEEEYLTRGQARKLGWLSFAAGFVFAVVILLAVFGFIRGDRLIPHDKAEYYASLDKKFGRYYQMEQIIRKNSIYKVTDRDLDSRLGTAMLSIVPDDKYSEYYTGKQYSDFRRMYLDSYSGIGIAVGESGGRLTVNRVISDGPAEEAGVQAGDVIVAINGKDVKSVDKATEMITGKEGTSVKLTVERNGSEQNFTIYRAKVEDRSVTSRILDDSNHTGYVQISTFRDGTSKELKDAIKDLQDQNCSNVIIDLRGNTGGVMKEGIKCADLLLPSAKIVTVKNKNGSKKTYKSDQSSLGVNCVILVDGETASASEIFAAAMHDNGTRLVGSRTYGKGVIQGLYKLRGGSYFKATIEEYYSPNGSQIDGKGITPDQITSGGEADITAAEALLAS